MKIALQSVKSQGFFSAPVDGNPEQSKALIVTMLQVEVVFLCVVKMKLTYNQVKSSFFYCN